MAALFKESAALDFQTMNKAIPINMYNTVQTGPKIQFGGFHDGLLMVVYQLPTDDAVKKLLIPPTASGIIIAIISFTILLMPNKTTRKLICLKRINPKLLVISDEPGNYFVITL